MSRILQWKWHWYDSVLLVLLAYLFLVQLQAIWPFTIDDMYISLRYAKHWAQGDGLVWNSHSLPVEGYSNFSFVVIATLALLAHVEPVSVLKWLGVSGLFGSGVFVFLLARFWFPPRLALIPCIYLLLYKGDIIWAVSGLETTVYQALICASLYFVFRGLGYRFYPYSRGQTSTLAFIGAGVLLALAGMTRPEAPILMILFFLLAVWDRPTTFLKQYRQRMIGFGFSFILLYVPYFLWRWHYYGYLFPNAVYCKGIAPHSWWLLDGTYLKLAAPFILLSLAAVWRAPEKRLHFLWLPSLVYLVLLAGADPIVAFDNRLFLPVFPLLLLLALHGMSQLVLWYLSHRDKSYYWSLSLCAVCLGVLAIPKMSLADYRDFTVAPVQGQGLRQLVVNWLHQHTSPDSRVVLADAGMIPYLSPAQFIDSYCLNELSIAHDAIDGRYERFCQRVMQQKPEVVILTSLLEKGKLLYTPADNCLHKAMLKGREYQMDASFSVKINNSRYEYELFRRLP